jgi:hypothetical protein
VRKGLDGRRKRLTEVSSSCVNREEIVLGHDLNLRVASIIYLWNELQRRPDCRMHKGLDGRRKRLTEVSSSCVNRVSEFGLLSLL